MSDLSIGQRAGVTLTGFLLIIIPALIAGFFSISPTIYNAITKPRASLSYNLVSGPSIPVDDLHLRIFSISIWNSGKTPLNDISLELSSANGQMEHLLTEKSALHPVIANNPALSSVSIKRMLPGDRVSASLMTQSATAEPALSVNVRSEEVLGVKENPEQNSSGQPLLEVQLLGAALTTISVALMAPLMYFVRARVFSKADIITFIPGLSQVVPMSDPLLLYNHHVSYARLNDIFLFVALSADENTKARCVAGMRALLILRKISDNSVEKIRENLANLGIKFPDEVFADMRKKTAGTSDKETRRQIFEIFHELESSKMV